MRALPCAEARRPLLGRALGVALGLRGEAAARVASHQKVSFMSMGPYCHGPACDECQRSGGLSLDWHYRDVAALWEAFGTEGLLPGPTALPRGWACPCTQRAYLGCSDCAGSPDGPGALAAPLSVSAAVAWVALGQSATLAEEIAAGLGEELDLHCPPRRLLWKVGDFRRRPHRVLRKIGGRPRVSFWNDGRRFYGHHQSVVPRLNGLWRAGTPLDGFLVDENRWDSDLLLSYWSP